MRIHALSIILLSLAACAVPRTDQGNAPQQMDREPPALGGPRERYRAMSGEDPSASDPVVVDAFVVETSPSVFELAVRIRMHEGWHIYAEVPDGQPYVLTDVSAELPDGASASQGWNRPTAHASLTTPGIEEWSGEAIFLQEIYASADFEREDPFVVTVAYQACDERMCLPPETVTIELALE